MDAMQPQERSRDRQGGFARPATGARLWKPGSTWEEFWRGPLLLAASGVLTVIACCQGYFGHLMGRGSKDYHAAVMNYWAPGLLAAAGIKLRVHGRERVDPKGVYVYISNHQSHMDVPALFVAVGKFVAFVAKKELESLPVFGPNLRLTGTVMIDRRKPDQAKQQLQAAGERLVRDGLSVFIFPEGTRSKSGDIEIFRKGAFRMALDLGLPLAPVVIEGTHAILPAGLRFCRGGEVDVHFLDPIDPAKYGPEGADRLLAEVRDSMIQFQQAIRRGESDPKAC